MRPTLLTCLVSLALTAPAAADPGLTPTPVEQWRFTLPGLDIEAALPRPDGALLVVGEFDRPLTLPDGATLTPVGGDDIALLLLSPTGQLKAAHALGGPEDEAAHDLIRADGRLLLALTTRGALTVGGRTVEAPPGANPYVSGVAGAVIALSPDGAPTAVLLDATSADTLRLAPVAGGFVLAHERDRMLDGPETATVARYVGAAANWSRTFEDLDVMRLDVMRGQLYLAAGGKRRLEVRPLDVQTGADAGPLTALETPFTGDRGGVVALVEGPVGPRMVGHSGRPPVKAPSGATESHTIEPFALHLGRPGKARRQIVDAVAAVAAVGRVGDELATVVDVIHTGPRYGGVSPSHPGVWLVVGLGAPSRRIALHVRGEGAPETGIAYVSPGRGSFIGEKALTLVGHCDPQAADIGCVVRIGLR